MKRKKNKRFADLNGIYPIFDDDNAPLKDIEYCNSEDIRNKDIKYVDCVKGLVVYVMKDGRRLVISE